MDLMSCSRCGKIHPRGYKCNVGRKWIRTDDKKLRSQYSWTMKAKQIKEDAQGLCEVCRAQGIYTYNNLEVHHITKLRDDKDGLLEDENLICLCVRHHKMADDGDIDADYLRSLAQERMRYV